MIFYICAYLLILGNDEMIQELGKLDTVCFLVENDPIFNHEFSGFRNLVIFLVKHSNCYKQIQIILSKSKQNILYNFFSTCNYIIQKS